MSHITSVAFFPLLSATFQRITNPSFSFSFHNIPGISVPFHCDSIQFYSTAYHCVSVQVETGHFYSKAYPYFSVLLQGFPILINSNPFLNKTSQSISDANHNVSLLIRSAICILCRCTAVRHPNLLRQSTAVILNSFHFSSYASPSHPLRCNSLLCSASQCLCESILFLSISPLDRSLPKLRISILIYSVAAPSRIESRYFRIFA